uniref:Putative odorant-binding protein n=1 Tax=Reticulitermes speratus TaxID=60591 RepID=A0A0U4MTW2_9NEOP
MKSATLLALLAVVTLDSASIKAAKLPATLTLCKRNDPNINACLQTSIEQAIRELKPGLPALHLLPVDPLDVTKITIEHGAGRPVSLNLEFNNVKSAGLSQSEVKTVRIDLDKRILEADAFVPKTVMEADYVMDGRFLVLPVKGNGKCKFDFTGMNATVKIEAEPQTKSGKVYWNVVNLEIDIKSMENFRVKFDNLFNGDKALGDSTNKVLNDNWKQFWEELKPSFEETFAAVFLQLAKAVFSRVPEENIFLE